MNNAQVLDTALAILQSHVSLSFQRKLSAEEAVRNCEQLKRREQEEDNVTIEELEKQRVEALWWRRRGTLWSRRELCHDIVLLEDKISKSTHKWARENHCR